MIITAANEFVGQVHDRMPVILPAEDFEPWLTGKTGLEMLRPAANDVLQRWPVSKRVNSSRAGADDPTLIDPTNRSDRNNDGLTARTGVNTKEKPRFGGAKSQPSEGTRQADMSTGAILGQAAAHQCHCRTYRASRNRASSI
jgi:hypothetical protein